MTTVKEWSDAFDVALASYIRITPFGHTDPLSFDEYEKSLFLTKAQEAVVKELYNSSSGITYFEKDESVRRQLSPLITQNTIIPVLDETLKGSLKHYNCTIPADCWYIVYEQAALESDYCGTKVLEVIPTTHDGYHKTVKNPFKGPNASRVLRLDNGTDNVELISTANITEYIIRYIAKPTPIVLDNLYEEGISVEGVGSPVVCILPETTHQSILDYAVKLAINSRISNNK